MRAELSVSQLYYNHSLINFFFRTQSEQTFNELFESVEEVQSKIFEAIENYSDDLDEIDKMFYNDSINEIAENLNLTLKNIEL